MLNSSNTSYISSIVKPSFIIVQVKYNSESRSDSFSAFDFNSGAVICRSVFYYGEPQTGAFLVPAPGDIGLVKTVPDLGDAVPGDTDAAVLDGNKHLLVFLCGFHVNLRIVMTEFYRIVYEVV